MNYTRLAIFIFLLLLAATVILYLSPSVRERSISSAFCSAYCHDHIENLTYGTCISKNISFGFSCAYSNTNVCNTTNYILLNKDCTINSIN
ncbi:MAG: hypothetical protein QXV12_02170 [Candidatus Rehaiarchaeum fermentans]|nr:hypothetical protein [Candidatus Rehaiarchaeum fermentans]